MEYVRRAGTPELLTQLSLGKVARCLFRAEDIGLTEGEVGGDH